MNNKPYAVVYFPKEEIYSEIPTEWLIDSTQCWWPKTINPKKLIEKAPKPEPESWDIYEIKIEGYSSTLDGARKKAAFSDFSSSNEEEKGRGKRKKIPAPIGYLQTSSSDEWSEQETPPPSPKHTDLMHPVPGTPDLSETENQAIDINTPAIFTDLPQLEPPADNNLHEGGNVSIVEVQEISLSTLYEEIVKLKNICIINKKYISYIHNKIQMMKCGHSTGPKETINLNIPLKSLEDFKQFEENIVEHENNLVSVIASVGGRDAKDHVYRGLSLLFSNELATGCSWLGQRNNFRIKDTRVAEIVIETLTPRYPTTKAELEKHISEWFRLSRQRLNREIKKF